MVVEDDDATREVLAMALELEGFDVVAFASAERALAALATVRPDALLTDLTLGGFGGAELVRQARTIPGCSALPCFAWTGWAPAGVPPQDSALFRTVFSKSTAIETLATTIRAYCTDPRRASGSTRDE